MDDNWQAAILARARRLHERIPTDPGLSTADDPFADASLVVAWRQQCSAGDERLFERRRQWARLETGRTRGSPMPRLAVDLDELLRTPVDDVDHTCLDPDDPLPFEDLCLPLTAWARRRTVQQAGAALASFAPQALARMQRRWLEWVCSLAARALWLELQIERHQEGSLLETWTASGPRTTAYQALRSRWRHGGLASFVSDYPVLARLLAEGLPRLAQAASELIGRFHEDRPSLADFFQIPLERLHVHNVEAGISDLHNGLRNVSVLELTGDERLVYKPRNLAVEVEFTDWLRELGAMGLPIDLVGVQALDRGNWGWVRHLAHWPCADEASLKRHYKRAGALIALAHVLGASDLHVGNVVAHGEHPVLIDLETLFTPVCRGAAQADSAQARAAESLSRSVLATCMLPYARAGRSMQGGFDPLQTAAFGEGTIRMLDVPQWVAINTDDMRIEQRMLEDDLLLRAARADGQPASVRDHSGAVLEGFADTWRWLVRHRARLLEPGRGWQRLAAVTIRFVHRHTALYDRLAQELRDPENLRDGMARSLCLEGLAQASLLGQAEDGHPGWSDLWLAERDALDRGDVPHFRTRADATDLQLDDGLLASSWFACSGHAAATQRLQALDEAGLNQQLDIIRVILNPLRPLAQDPKPARTRRQDPSNPSQWLDLAGALAGDLAATAIVGADGSAAWLQPVASGEPPFKGYGVAPNGPGLYDGAVGIALFLGMAARACSRQAWADAAMAAVHGVLQELRLRPQDLVEEVGIGGLTGVGSLAYGLTMLHRVLGHAELAAGAMQAARTLEPDRLRGDSAHDLTDGLAGALMGLLAVYRTSGDTVVLDALRQGSTALAGRLKPMKSGTGASLPTLDGLSLAGMAHGAAGMAHALWQVHCACGDTVAARAAQRLWTFEQSLFDPLRGDWPDQRIRGRGHFVCAWCHGAPGIALSRMQEPDSSSRSLQAAIRVTAHADTAADHLCCGEFGVIDTLGTAARELGRADLMKVATDRAHAAVSRAADTGGYDLALPGSGSIRCRGLFNGEAGIGYALLRLAGAGPAPAVLRLM